MFRLDFRAKSLKIELSVPKLENYLRIWIWQVTEDGVLKQTHLLADNAVEQMTARVLPLYEPVELRLQASVRITRPVVRVHLQLPEGKRKVDIEKWPLQIQTQFTQDAEDICVQNPV